ncbi:FAD-binding-2 domain-containing protein [Aphelenchoides bicaudatus]|nr:FAD-binding-2 domain-containing protein [Aphelenchoides bicaudatus]
MKAQLGLLLLIALSTMEIVEGLTSKAPKHDEPVIVVGGGLAGLTATISALEHGASKVYLVDKEKDIGGNSAKATSGINACNTAAQEAAGVKDSPDKFYTDTMTAGDRENEPGLVDVLVHNSAEAVNFLIEKGVDLSAINLCGGHTVPRTHWLPVAKEGKPLPVGVAIIRALKKYLTDYKEKNPDKLEILTESSVVGLVTWNDYITGVRYHNKSGYVEELRGKSVILTTGGYSADRDNATSLLKQHASQLLNLPTTNGAFATGDGIKMASAMGAEVVGLDYVQVHPTAFVDPKDPAAATKFLAAEALRGKGALLVNDRGVRFGNELGRRDYLTQRINENCAKSQAVNNLPVSYMVLNDEIADAFGRPSFNFYANIKGFFGKFDNFASMASTYKFSESAQKSFEAHNEFYEKQKNGDATKDEFGKTVFPVKFEFEKPIYAAQVTPAIHFTMGGLKIDRNAVVFSEFMQKPFQGLFAAGEVTGGVHGRNRLAGNSLLECVVFGRIAGREASYVNHHSKREEL